MFSNNDKISPRQIKRLLIFDLFGAGSLLLPSRLAESGGGSGMWSICFGLILAVCYLWMLQICCGRMKQDYMAYLQSGWGSLAARFMYICYGLVSLFVSGWAAKLLADLVCNELLDDREFPVALLLILLLALYGGAAGLESRARIYEIMYWVLAVPFVIMLLLCVRQVQTVRWFPLLPVTSGTGWSRGGIVWGSIQCFAVFLPLTFLLFLKSHEQDESRTGRSAVSALLISGGAVAAVYMVLTGIFGSGALVREAYPVITLMGMVRILGDFVKRLDAVMIGVWFFTLDALIAATLYYSVTIAIRALAGKAAQPAPGGSRGADRSVRIRKYWFGGMTAAVYGIAYGFHLEPRMEQLASKVFYMAGLPFLVLVPLFSNMICRVRRRKHNPSDTGQGASRNNQQ